MSRDPNTTGGLPLPDLEKGAVYFEVASGIAHEVDAMPSWQVVPPRWYVRVWNQQDAEKLGEQCREAIKTSGEGRGHGVQGREGFAALRRRLNLLVPQVCETCGDALDSAALHGWGQVECTPCLRQRRVHRRD